MPDRAAGNDPATTLRCSSNSPTPDRRKKRRPGEPGLRLHPCPIVLSNLVPAARAQSERLASAHASAAEQVHDREQDDRADQRHDDAHDGDAAVDAAAEAEHRADEAADERADDADDDVE